MSKHLLVVDDSESNTLLIKSLFEDQGDYTVDVISKSSTAIDKMLEKQPNVVLLDLMMPQVDGFQILETMKSNEKLKDIPVLIVSAWDSIENIEKAKSLGAAEYVSKPIGLANLHELVEKYT